jgi:hypothetical protein
MENPFFDEEANEIVQRMTNTPFSADDSFWLYWLFEISLIPGAWTCRFYLEQNDPEDEKRYSFGGCGSPSTAVKEAYNSIDKEWLEEGSIKGKIKHNVFIKHWKKNDYWTHFLKNKQFWGNGFTEKRLQEIKKEIWMDNYFWDDVLVRHSGMDFSPDAMKQNNEKVYEHCMGNMTGMIMRFLVEKKIIK